MPIIYAEKPTREWLEAMIEDEEKASKEYARYGFLEIAADEARHKRILEKFLMRER